MQADRLVVMLTCISGMSGSMHKAHTTRLTGPLEQAASAGEHSGPWAALCNPGLPMPHALAGPAPNADGRGSVEMAGITQRRARGPIKPPRPRWHLWGQVGSAQARRSDSKSG